MIRWEDILPNWALVLMDLHEVYGVDLYDPKYDARPWVWLRELIFGLYGTDSRLRREIYPPKD